MRNLLLVSLAGSSLLITSVCAQTEGSGEGIELGWIILQPEAGVLGAYDDRVVMESETKADGDFYYETFAGLAVRNRPARYEFSASALYGYRSYSDYSDFSDDFYSANVRLNSDEGKLNWGADASIRKLLDYETSYNPNTGVGPDSIITDQENTRSQVRAYVSYEQNLSDRISLVPEYSFWYYNQQFPGYDISSTNAFAGTTNTSSRTEEWTVHQVSLPVQYAVTDKTLVSLGVRGSVQNNEDEEGIIGTVYAGAKGQVTDKTTWSLYLGVSAADYKESGSDVGGVSRARLAWQATEKINVYAFGGNEYEPGYNGGAARMVYRAGYGAAWNIVEQWVLSATGLHNLEREINAEDSNRYQGTRSFFTASATYSLPRWAELSFIGRYINDELKVDNMIGSIELTARY